LRSGHSPGVGDRATPRRDHSSSKPSGICKTPYDKEIAALLVVDPYNDFSSEGGKTWPRIKAVAEANNCVDHMLEVLNAARRAKSASSMRCIVAIARATSETWK
jgi:hypothetical protein